MEIKASKEGLDWISKNVKDEKIFLEEVKHLIDRLDSYELIFFIYFNPYISKEMREHFISNSEIKKSLISKKNHYINVLIERK